MKNKILLLLSFILISFLSINAQVFITELADPNNNANVRYIELYNAGDVAIDFTENSGWRIDKYTNASSSVSQTLNLTGTIQAKGFYIIATGTDDGEFLTVYGVSANQFDGADNDVAGSNGDDNLELYDGNGVLIDQFGVPGVDGTGTNHEFEDGRAERVATVTTGNATWDVNEWNIDNDSGGGDGTQDAPADFDPGSWIGVAPTNDQTSTITAGTMPAAANIVSTETNSTAIFQFTVTDAGGDGAATIINRVRFDAGTNNNLDFVENLDGGTLYNVNDASTNLINELDPTNVIAADYIDMAVNNITIADGTSETFEVALIINNANVPDGGILQFQINATHGFTTDASGSGFVTDLGGDITGNEFTIDVTATQLIFTQPPTNVAVNEIMFPSVLVAATDAGGNVDKDYAPTDITLNFSGPATMSGTNPQSTVDGVATFNDLSFDAANSGVNLTASGAFSPVTSNNFDITALPTAPIPYLRNFDTGDINTDGWHTEAVSNVSYDWTLGSGYITMTNNTGTPGEYADATSWYVSPAFDASTSPNIMFNFKYTVFDLASGKLNVKISTDYDGTSDPSSQGTWTDLTVNYPADDYYSFNQVDDIDLSSYIGGNFYLAFVFSDTDGDNTTGNTWSIDDITLYTITVPIIEDITINPTAPTSVDPVTISATITDDVGVTAANLFWSTSSPVTISDNSLEMSVVAGSTYASQIPPQGSGLTVYYFIAANDGSKTETTSEEKSYTVAIDEVTIHDIQYTTEAGDGTYPSLLVDQIVKTSGVVSAVNGSRYFLQDADGAWNGAYVYDGTNIPSIGDSIAITCTVVEYYGLTELKDITEYEVKSSGETVHSAIEVTTLDANDEQYESVLIKVTGATCTNADAGYGMWELNDNSGALLADDDIFEFTPTANFIYDVTGLGFYSHDAYKILPRDASDIVETPTTSVNDIFANSISIYPNPSNGIININVKENLNIEVLDIAGKVLQTKNVSSNTTINIPNAGVYFLRFSNENGSTVKNVVIK